MYGEFGKAREALGADEHPLESHGGSSTMSWDPSAASESSDAITWNTTAQRTAVPSSYMPCKLKGGQVPQQLVLFNTYHCIEGLKTDRLLGLLGGEPDARLLMSTCED